MPHTPGRSQSKMMRGLYQHFISGGIMPLEQVGRMYQSRNLGRDGIGRYMPLDLKQSLIELLKEYIDVFSCPTTVEKDETICGIENQRRGGETMECRVSYNDRIPSMSGEHNVLVDNTTQHVYFSFMDDFSGYNQIKVALEGREKTTFITMWGTFYNIAMPFGLKNARVTYQRAMVALFHDMMHKEIEVYVDDMIAKSKTLEQHVEHLLQKYKLRLNLAKCTFGIKSGKLLGFIVNERGIELTATCGPIFKLLRKNQKAEWNLEHQEAFEKIKRYLENPSVLVPAVAGRPLILYLIVLEESMGCVLGQHDATKRKEKAIYHISKKFTDCEKRYSALERTCNKKAETYMLANTTWLMYKTNPIKYIFEKLALTGRIVWW
ncbi:Retrovirus-related Pol polyprotein from transposon 17.6, partial [Mucuna pruriens]